MSEKQVDVVEGVSSLDKIAAALAAAQGELSNPVKNKTANAGKFSYSYADLATILDHVRPVLAKYGLSPVQLVTVQGEKNVLVTRLIHASGQFFESTYPLPRQAGSQEMGSCITYARRYSLAAILGIAAEDDDDGARGMQAGGAAGMDEESMARNELIERMGSAAIGNGALMAFCRAHGHKGDESTVEALSLKAVLALLENWDKAVAEIKAGAKLPKNSKKVPDLKPKPEEISGKNPDLEGIEPGLAKKMAADGISPEMLKAYYVGAGHLPDSVDPEKLPETYIKAITQTANWKKALTKMKEA